MTDSFQRITYPELLFGFVAPIGADIRATIEAFRSYFERRNYIVVEIKVTEIFSFFEKYVAPDTPLVRSGTLHARYSTYISYGNKLRNEFDDEILAATTIRRVMKRRLRLQKGDKKFSST